MALYKHIPNTITSMNLLCGAMGVIYAMQGRMKTAFIFMLLAAVFDFCDGLAARMLKAYSPIGKDRREVLYRPLRRHRGRRGDRRKLHSASTCHDRQECQGRREY